MTQLLCNDMIRAKEILQPKFFKKGYAYIGTDEQWHIKEDAPEEIKQEFIEFFKQINAEPNKQGIVTKY